MAEPAWPLDKTATHILATSLSRRRRSRSLPCISSPTAVEFVLCRVMFIACMLLPPHPFSSPNNPIGVDCAMDLAQSAHVGAFSNLSFPDPIRITDAPATKTEEDSFAMCGLRTPIRGLSTGTHGMSAPVLSE